MSDSDLRPLLCILCKLVEMEDNFARFIINGQSVCSRGHHIHAARRSSGLDSAEASLRSMPGRGAQS